MKGADWLLFFILLFFFWPAAFIYYFVRQRELRKEGVLPKTSEKVVIGALLGLVLLVFVIVLVALLEI